MSNSAPATPPKLTLSLAQRLALGTRLTELRTQRGLTQLDVARQALGFEKSHAAVSRLERGVLDAVSAGRLADLCAFYGTTATALLAQTDARQEEEPETEFTPVDGLAVAPGIGARLTLLRQAAGLTRSALAALLGHDESWTQHLRLWEKEKSLPRPDTLLRMAVKLEVSAAWLITGKRAKPLRPTTAMRVNALQKMHDLSNQDLAHLAGLDITAGRSAIARLTRGRRVGEATLQAVATALDVPVSWITPPEGEPVQGPKAAQPDPRTTLTVPAELSKRGRALMEELAKLLGAGVVTEQELSQLRANIMRKVMADLRKSASAPVAIAQACV